MGNRSIRALHLGALVFFASACADSGQCGGSPFMPVCESTGASPAEPHLVFMSDHEGVNQIYTLNSDGSGLRRLTHTPEANLFPRWSRDGNEIVFASERDGRRDIYVMSADGSNQGDVSVAHVTPDSRTRRQGRTSVSMSPLEVRRSSGARGTLTARSA